MALAPSNIYAADVAASVLVYPILPGSKLGRPAVGRVQRVATAYAWIRTPLVRDHLRVARATGRGSVYGESFQVQIPTPEELANVRRLEALEAFHGAIETVSRAITSPGSPAKALCDAMTADVERVTGDLRALLGLPRSPSA